MIYKDTLPIHSGKLDAVQVMKMKINRQNAQSGKYI